MTDQINFTNMSAGTLLEYMGMDAQKWTQAFLQMTDLANAGPDFQGTVLSWFANALEVGRTAQYTRSIPHLAQTANETAHEKGWWESSRSFGEVIALIHSEASEALEEWRDNHELDQRYYTVAKYRPEPESLRGPSYATGSVREWARTLDRRGDGGFVAADELPEEIAESLTLQGFLKPEGVPAELADIFIRIGDAAAEYGIDLEEEVILKMAYNSTRPQKHGGKRA